jgi:hypothetical protein
MITHCILHLMKQWLRTSGASLTSLCSVVTQPFPQATFMPLRVLFTDGLPQHLSLRRPGFLAQRYTGLSRRFKPQRHLVRRLACSWVERATNTGSALRMSAAAPADTILNSAAGRE